MRFRYQPGDILVQHRGQPWPFLALIVTGMPFPHAQMVVHVEDCPIYASGQRVFIIENHADGVREREAWNLDWFLVVRPRCAPDVKDGAIRWMREHEGAFYGVGHLLKIVAGTRLGLWRTPENYDDMAFDQNDMVCSEAIARAYWRAGYDLVPGVSNRDTLPGELIAFLLADVYRDGVRITPLDLVA